MEFTSTEDALDAIDNMNFNELNGRILKVNMARPMKGQQAAGSNRAGESSFPFPSLTGSSLGFYVSEVRGTGAHLAIFLCLIFR